MTVPVTILPALDIADGHSVRLRRGEAASQAATGTALSAAADLLAAGPRWIHLVDIDRAFGRGHNDTDIAAVLAEAAAAGVAVQLSGGIHPGPVLEQAVATTAERIVLPTDALTDLDAVAAAIATYGDRLAVALDVDVSDDDHWRLVDRGTKVDAGDLWEVLEALDSAGVARVIVTDRHRDGALTGPHLPLLEAIAYATDAAVTASGGISSLEDLSALAALAAEDNGLDSAIIGTALYSGDLDLATVLAHHSAT